MPSDYEKLEYIHCALQDVLHCAMHPEEDSTLDAELVEQSLYFVETLGAKHFDSDGNLKEDDDE